MNRCSRHRASEDYIKGGGKGVAEEKGSCAMAVGPCFARRLRTSVTFYKLGRGKRKQLLGGRALRTIYN